MKTIPVSTWARVRHRPAGGRNVDGGENRKPRTKKNNEKRVGRGNYDAQQKSLKEEWHGIGRQASRKKSRSSALSVAI